MRLTFKYVPTGRGNNLRRLYQYLDRVGNYKLEYGIFAKAGMHSDSGLYVAGIAAIHELRQDGWERPFLRYSTTKNKHMIRLLLRGIRSDIRTIATSRSFPSAAKLFKPIGQFGVKTAKEIVGSKVWLIPNTPQWVKRKGNDKPLVEQGILRDSLDYRIVKKESTK